MHTITAARSPSPLARNAFRSYNAVNGVPMCANNFLLKTVMRDTWGFDGYITVS